MQLLIPVYVFKYCFSQSNILSAATCVAHSASFDFARAEKLAYSLACCYPELRGLRNLPSNVFPHES